VAPPGILEARYRRLAGDEARRVELYQARRRLGFTINEWLSLPWWQRRVYVEGLNAEAEAAAGHGVGQGSPASGADPVTAILEGTLEDVAATGGYSTG